ncbi:hypothetical protein JYT22_00950 [Endomicrobium sp. AH-315-J14]|nr:hypothetical protein [Endomicrobium sp. AH-315-J14]
MSQTTPRTPTLEQLLTPPGPDVVFSGARWPEEVMHLPGAVERFRDLPRHEALLSQVTDAEEGHLDVLRAGVGQAASGESLDGCSLRMNRLQVLDTTIRAFALGLLDTLQEEINVNAYLSPGATEGLAPHSDLYPVLVLQLEGEKEWQLLDNKSDVLRKICLTPGDVLVVPRGVRHRAVNERDAPSFHLTVGVLTKTRLSLVEWLAAELGRISGWKNEMVLGIEPARAEWSYADGLSDLASATEQLVRDGGAARFAEYRRGIDFERTLATPEEYARLDARRYR